MPKTVEKKPDKDYLLSQKAVLIVSFFLLIFFGIFLAIGIALARHNYINESVCTEKLTAEVTENVEVKKYTKKRWKTNYAPVFEYDYNGEHYRVQSTSYSAPPKYRVGEKVEIRIDPNDPKLMCSPLDHISVIVIAIFLLIGAPGTLFILFLDIRAIIRIIKYKAKRGDRAG